ncbi:hypothetical protein BJ508DRAFT_63403 [Ascobolus immersus RN42]|uniref:Uncharacterized protein n=1 Tax=Ascobolus immersus RN42 TaxID=1160509 RepID=A0A3N4IQH1_ASCIM|nr:hypothetical protein BJ508DRAFT_63403 [Ascobolus immersus RN42]
MLLQLELQVHKALKPPLLEALNSHHHHHISLQSPTTTTAMHLLPTLLTLTLALAGAPAQARNSYSTNPTVEPTNTTETTIISKFLLWEGGAGTPGINVTSKNDLIALYPKCAKGCAENYFDTYVNECDTKWMDTRKHVQAGWACVCAYSFQMRIADMDPYDTDLSTCAIGACEGEKAEDLGAVFSMRRKFQEFCERNGRSQSKF